MNTIKLNKGHMPLVGLGTWKASAGEVYVAVKAAIRIGYRHIDCASVYGNEREVGKAISESIAEGVVKRSDLWITSKLWNNAHGKSNVMPALKQTLADLQLDYLDLYLIHWPVAFKPDVNDATEASHYLSLEEQPLIDTWRGLEEAYQLNLVSNIGVSNFSVKKLSNLLSKAEIKPAVNQVELHVYLQQKELVNFCNSNNIVVTAYSPLGSSDRPDHLKHINDPSVLTDPKLKILAEKNNCSIAQLVLAYSVAKGIVVIPKSTNEARLKQNLEAINVKLNADDIAAMHNMDMNHRFIHGNFFVTEGGPYSLANLWD
ncbi:aldo/keto reductase [Saccharicrinis aurantiacus]|uniref:aldo/keto reductase n=1 Tax=Saccharicrinis aurantiacus TaxID=1849719 RepID=UPI0024900819|nr:aldo/keto reductase [Saccharicrinis aurantiacus]